MLNKAKSNKRKRKSASCTVLIMVLTALLTGGCASTNEQSEQPSTETTDSRIPQLRAAEAAENSPDDIEPTVVAFRDYRDPLIKFNRAVFAFNDVSYRYLLIPLSKGYTKVMPEPAKKGVSNFFYNLKSPIYLVNNTLQLKPKAAATNLVRFGINSTIGLLGLFDPAKHWFDIEKANTNFEATLAQYGAGYGVYLVLPLLGPSDLRDGTSALTEGFLHPISYLADNPDRIIIQSFDYFQDFAPNAERYKPLKEESDDPYIFFRNLYLQGVQRDAAYQ